MTVVQVHDGINRPGWGTAADPANDPTYPMRDRSQDDKKGMNWARPTLQATPIEVLRSTEHPHLTAVYGTSAPPSGLSGVLRRSAFKRSESKWTHWLFLLFADRINVVEGIFDDIRHGSFPNILGEMGLRAELRHNKRGFFKKLSITFVAIAGIVALIWLLVS